MGIAVRRATPSDIDWLLEQLKELSAFVAWAKGLYGDEAYVRVQTLNLIDKHLVLVAEDESGPVGFIGGYVCPHPWNPGGMLLSEAFWWVSECIRGTRKASRAGLALLDEFIAWGKANVKWISLGLQHNNPIGLRALSKRGMHVKELHLVMEVA